MPADTLFTITDLRRISQERQIFDLDFFPDPPQTPENMIILAIIQGFRIQWSKVDGVDGYRIAVMDDNNLETPKRIIEVTGQNTLEYEWYVGDVAITRQFSVQSYKGDLSSAWYYPITAATSKAAGGASDSAPTQPPSSLPSTDDSSKPGWGKKQVY